MTEDNYKLMGFFIQQLDDAKDLPLPRYMTDGAAGMDLCANVCGDFILRPMERAIVPCGFKMAMPMGYEAQIRPRSGLALKHGISMPNAPGTIDADYRGEVGVLLINLGDTDFVIRRGDRIAQMIINKIERIQFKPVDTLPDSGRGGGGFGSTGKTNGDVG
ncbi:MAG: dUTP diphosphatase [Defluviitaleaceae bacterium]|nr:dUTP diphosphatase [Defluviitaleaceae bacterium]